MTVRQKISSELGSQRGLEDRTYQRRRARIVFVLVVGFIVAAISVLALPGPADDSGLKAAHAAQVAACGAQIPNVPSAVEQREVELPEIKSGVDYRAVVTTSCGQIAIDLLEHDAPNSVSSFVHLAKMGFYSGLEWDQVMYNSYIRTGDPNNAIGMPPEDAGYVIRDDRSQMTRRFRYGDVGLVNTGSRNTGGSQFFIAVHDYESAIKGRTRGVVFPREYALFGRVLKRSFPIAETIARQKVGESLPQVYVESIKIIRRPQV